MSPGSLYDSRSKLLFAAADPERARLVATALKDAADAYNLHFVDGTLTVEHNGEAVIGAPAGACAVVTSDGTAAVVETLLDLWRDTDLTPPDLVEIGSSEAPDLATEIALKLNAALTQELTQTAQAAVDLDLQIAALREQLEDLRSTVTELRRDARLGGALPTETFRRDALKETCSLQTEQRIVQRMPLPGNKIRGFAICCDGSQGLGAGAGLEIRLVAKEDGETLARWAVAEQALPRKSQAWVTLALNAEVPHRYRFVDLHVTLRHAQAPVGLWMAEAGGDPRVQMDAPAATAPDRMLALRIWTGQPFRDDRRNDDLIFDLTSPGEGDLWQSALPHQAFSAVERVTNPEVALKWFRTEDDGLFVHPTMMGASIVCMPLSVFPQISGLATRLELAHDRAFTTAFGIVCATRELDAAAVLAALDPAKPDPSGIVARLQWAELKGGSARPITLPFDRPVTRGYAYFATEGRGKRVDFAHAWFREVRMLRSAEALWNEPEPAA